MEYLSIILTVALIHLLAVMSPGPDFIITVKNSLIYSRRSGIYCAVGLGLGNLVHVTYCLVGIAVIISKSIILFSTIKYIGAAYLFYVGFRALRAKPSHDNIAELTANDTIGKLQAVRSGFIANVTNPKATLFFLSLFTLVIDPGTPLSIRAIMAGEMVLATTIWFSIVAVVVSHRLVRTRMVRIQHRLEQFMGGVLILFGLRVATEHTR